VDPDPALCEVGECLVNLLDRLAESGYGKPEPFDTEHLAIQDTLHIRVIQAGDVRSARVDPGARSSTRNCWPRDFLSWKALIADQSRKTWSVSLPMLQRSPWAVMYIAFWGHLWCSRSCLDCGQQRGGAMN
jgi:hypothetical protein